LTQVAVVGKMLVPGKPGDWVAPLAALRGIRR